MNNNSDFSYFVFDLDNTLIDTTRLKYAIFITLRNVIKKQIESKLSKKEIDAKIQELYEDTRKKRGFISLAELCYQLSLTYNIDQSHLLNNIREIPVSKFTLPGAKELLAELKKQGKKIIIYTEGALDDQEWKIRSSGLLFDDHYQPPYIEQLQETKRTIPQTFRWIMQEDPTTPLVIVTQKAKDIAADILAPLNETNRPICVIDDKPNIIRKVMEFQQKEGGQITPIWIRHGPYAQNNNIEEIGSFTTPQELLDNLRSVVPETKIEIISWPPPYRK